jgi:hypothetical protein
VDVEPSATDWVTAVSTAGAFVAAIAAAIIAGVVFRHDRAARRAEQASRVGAWIEWRQSLRKNLRGEDVGGYVCIVANTSRLPVYDVTVDYSIYDEGRRRERIAIEGWLHLPPGEHVDEVPRDVTEAASRTAETGEIVRVAMTFTDTSGRRWDRDVDGRLTEHRPERPTRPQVRPEDLILSMRRCDRDRD